MAQAVASSSQPAQIPALDSPHLGQTDGKKHKEKKEKVAMAGGSLLEVCRLRSSGCACSPIRAAEPQAGVL